MIRYRSMRRALKRDHFIDIRTGTYKSKVEQRILREKWVAMQRKENNDGSGTKD